MATPMVSLAFDTSTAQGGVAVLENSKILKRVVWDRTSSHGELLTPALARVVSDSGLEMRDITHIAIGNGPGSFTGVRIAVNAAKALSYALDRPLFLFDTSEILAAGITDTKLPVAILINAFKNMVFFSTFRWTGAGWEKAIALDAVTLSDVESSITTPHICVGDGYQEYQAAMSSRLRSLLVRDSHLSDFPLPEVLGKQAFLERTTRPPLVWKDAHALYIRASGAEETLTEKLKKTSGQEP